MVERKTLNLVVEGSIPSEGVFFVFAVTTWGTPNTFTAVQTLPPQSKHFQRLQVHSKGTIKIYQLIHQQNMCGPLAQLVEHWSNKPRVAGSSPVGTIFVLWQKNKSFVRDKKSPSVGIEPTAIGLKGQRSTV